MLKRRIFAASLASVLALSSFSVSAFAEEEKDFDSLNVVTKAELRNYLDSKDIKSLIDGDVDNYGEITGENFIKAVDFANNVLENEDATSADYTVAFQMVKAEKKRLVIRTAEELRSLIGECKSTYEAGNVLYKDVEDLKYTDTSWAKFEEAYDDADSVVESGDTRMITNSWEALKEAKDDLSLMKIVTKSEFRSAWTEFQNARANELKIQPWQRGTVSGTGTKYDGKTYAWGSLYYHVNSGLEDIEAQYKEFVEVGSHNTTSNEAVYDAYTDCKLAAAILNGFEKDTISGGESKFTSLFKKYQSQLVHDYNSAAANKLGDEIYGVVVTADSKELKAKTNSDSDTDHTLGITSEANYTDGKGDGEYDNWFELKTTVTNKPNDTWSVKVDKLVEASLNVKATEDYYIAVNKKTGKALTSDGETFYVYNSTSAFDTAVADSGEIHTAVDGNESDFGIESLSDVGYIKRSKGIYYNLAELVEPFADDAYDVDADMLATNFYNNVIDGDDGIKALSGKLDTSGGTAVDMKTANFQFGGSDRLYDDKNSGQDDDGSTKYIPSNKSDAVNTGVQLALANELYKSYKTEGAKEKSARDYEAIEIGTSAKANIHTIDNNGVVAEGKASGTTTEWALIYSYYKYALEDMYDASTGTKTKKDVVALITDAEKLFEDTGDCALFAVSHKNLVDAIENAKNWVKAANADKLYSANKKTYPYDTENLVDNAVYNKLKDAYDQLNKELKAFNISYSEVYDLISMSAKMVDENKNGTLDALKDAIDAAAHRLITVNDVYTSDGDILENDRPFDDDGSFLGYNRIFTNDGEFNGLVLTADGTKTKIAKSKNGDNQSHYDLKTAYEALQTAYDALTSPTTTKGDVPDQKRGNRRHSDSPAKIYLHRLIFRVEVFHKPAVDRKCNFLLILPCRQLCFFVGIR